MGTNSPAKLLNLWKHKTGIQTMCMLEPVGGLHVLRSKPLFSLCTVSLNTPFLSTHPPYFTGVHFRYSTSLL